MENKTAPQLNEKKNKSFYLIFAFLFFIWILFLILNYTNLGVLAGDIKYFFTLSNLKTLTGVLRTAFYNLSSIFWFFVILTAAAGIGKFIVKKFKIDLTLAEKTFYSIALGFAALSYAVLLIGVLKLLYPLPVKAALLFLFVLSVRKIKLPRISLRERISRFSGKTDIVMKLTLLAVMLPVMLNLIMILAPETFYDALVYHFAAPNYYIMHNAVKPVEYLAHSNFPSNQQMLYTAALLTGNEITARAIHAFMFFASLAVIFLTVKKFFDFKTAFYAFALSASFYLFSVNIWKRGNDAAVVFYFLLALHASFSYMKTQKRFFLFIAFFFCGLMIALKYTALITVSAIVIPLTVYFLTRKIKLKVKLIVCVFLIFLILLPLAPWLLKNYIFTGNPVYPFFYRFFNDYQLAQKESSVIPLSLNHFQIKDIFRIFWNSFIHGAVTDIFLIAFLPMLFFVNYKNKFAALLSAVFVLSYLQWLIGWLDLRFILPALVSLIILTALGLKAASDKIKIIAAAAPLIIVFNFFYLNYNFFRQLGTEYYFKGAETKEEYLSSPRAAVPAPPYAVINWLNKNLPSNSKILFIGESRSYYMQRDYISYSAELNRQPLMEFLKMSFDEEDFYNLLKKRNITHLLINYKEAVRVQESHNHFYWTKSEREIFDAFWKKHIKPLAFQYGTYLYEIKDVLNENDKTFPNILEKLSVSGWTNKNLSRIYYENLMYDSLIDDMNIYEHLGADLSDEKNKIKELKKSGENHGE